MQPKQAPKPVFREDVAAANADRFSLDDHVALGHERFGVGHGGVRVEQQLGAAGPGGQGEGVEVGHFFEMMVLDFF